jgi:sugar phosphate isomerase/epimerase
MRLFLKLRSSSMSPQIEVPPRRPSLAISSLFQYVTDHRIPYTTLAQYNALAQTHGRVPMQPAHHHEMHGEYLYSRKEMRQLADLLSKLGMCVRDVHGTHGKDPKGPQGLCWSTDEDDRLVGVQLIRNRIDLTEALGGSVLTLHVSSAPTVAKLTAIRRTMQEAERYARQQGVRIALENMHYLSYLYHDVIGKLLAEFDPEVVGVCFDTGHGNCLTSGLDFAREFNDRIIAVHLNDNLGPVNNNDTDEDASAGDRHMLLYSGTVNWADVADVLCNSPYFTVEGGPINMEIGHRRHPEIKDINIFLDRVYETGMRFAEELELARMRVELKR